MVTARSRKIGTEVNTNMLTLCTMAAHVEWLQWPIYYYWVCICK